VFIFCVRNASYVSCAVCLALGVCVACAVACASAWLAPCACPGVARPAPGVPRDGVRRVARCTWPWAEDSFADAEQPTVHTVHTAGHHGFGTFLYGFRYPLSRCPWFFRSAQTSSQLQPASFRPSSPHRGVSGGRAFKGTERSRFLVSSWASDRYVMPSSGSMGMGWVAWVIGAAKRLASDATVGQ